MALLGPAPAAPRASPAAASTRCAGACAADLLLNNLLTYATFPLLGGLVLHWLQRRRGRRTASYAVAVFVVFIAANVLNFAMIAGHTVLLRGGSLLTMFRTVYLPVLPWDRLRRR